MTMRLGQRRLSLHRKGSALLLRYRGSRWEITKGQALLLVAALDKT